LYLIYLRNAIDRSPFNERALALLVSSLIILPRVRSLSRAIARSQVLMRSRSYRQKT